MKSNEDHRVRSHHLANVHKVQRRYKHSQALSRRVTLTFNLLNTKKINPQGHHVSQI